MVHRLHPRASAIALTALGVAQLALGQGLSVHAMSGQPVPGGLPGERFGYFPSAAGGYTIPRINNGWIAFRASTTAQSQFFPFFVGQVGDARAAIRVTDTSPIVGTTFALDSSQEVSRAMRVTSAGEVGAMLKIQGPTVSTTNDEIVVRGRSGALNAVAREGDQSPGDRPGTVLHAINSGVEWRPFTSDWALAGTARSAFCSALTRPPLPLGLDAGVLTDNSGELLLAGRGSYGSFGTGPAVEGWPIHIPEGSPSVNDFGTVAFFAEFDTVGGSPSASVVISGNGAPRRLISTGDAPGMPGVRMSPSLPQGLPLLSAPGFNNSGEAAAAVVLQNGSGQVVGSGVVVTVSGAPQFVAKSGDPKPGRPGEVFTTTDLRDIRVVLSGSGAVAFADQSQRGVWIGHDSGDLRMAFDPISAAWPSALGEAMVNFNTVGMNASNQLVAALTFPASPGSMAVAGWDPVVGDVLLAYTGQTIELFPGVFRTIRYLDINGVDGIMSGGGQDGRPNSLDNAGRIVFTAHFTNNESAVLVGTIPAPTSAVCLLTGLLITGVRRRAGDTEVRW